MTDLEAHALNVRYPHLSPASIAYSAGRNSVDFGGKCEFTDPALRAKYFDGRCSAMAEDALSADTEWDEDISDE